MLKFSVMWISVKTEIFEKEVMKIFNRKKCFFLISIILEQYFYLIQNTLVFRN